MKLKQKWTFYVEGFGKIKSAKIKIAPLLFFVGDNNSGKSYLMSLLWGVLTIGKDVFTFKESTLDSYQKCEKWLVDNYGNEIEVDNEIQILFVNWFNELLDREKKELTRKIFNYPVEIGKIRIDSFERHTKLKIKWAEGAQKFSISDNLVKFPLKDISEFNKESRARMLAYICWNLIMQDLAAPLFTPIVKGKRVGEPIYLPASRTGFMLAKESLYDYAVSKTFNAAEEDGHESAFTLPYTDFLKTILKFDTSQKGQYTKVTEFLERNVLQGKIEAEKEVIPTIKYTPNGMKKSLPLHVSSSVVTELAPLVLLLKSGIKFNLLIIEEPEAHLHPKLQLLIARTIIRLVNEGLPVWVTTHSDTIMQHVNNMLKVENTKTSEETLRKHGFEKDDLTKNIEILMYQFDAKESNRTEITPVLKEEDGFIIGTFNETYYGSTETNQRITGGLNMFDETIKKKLKLIDKNFIIIGDKSMILEETSSEGRAELTVELSKPALAFKKLDEKRLKYFNCQNSADHILFLDTDMGWELHVIEMKKTVAPSKWTSIKEQFKGAILNGICLAGFLGIKIIKIKLYTAFRNNKFDKSTLTDIIELKSPLGIGGKTLSPIEEWQKGIAKIELDEEIDYIHSKIELDKELGLGSIAI